MGVKRKGKELQILKQIKKKNKVYVKSLDRERSRRGRVNKIRF